MINNKNKNIMEPKIEHFTLENIISKDFFLMKTFNVIIYDFNHKKFVPYDIIPYFVQTYEELKEKKYKKVPKTFEEFKEFVRSEGMYQFWARCEYEIILVDWPGQKVEKKIDVWNQIEMNLDIVTRIVMDSINGS